MKITFFMLASLKTGRGTENVVINLIKYKPEDIEITIIEPEFTDGIRIDEEEIKRTIRDCKVIKINVHRIDEKTLYKRLWSIFVTRSILKDAKNMRETEIYNEMRDTDLVYLFYNLYSVFFSALNIPIIGSEHTDVPSVFLLTRRKSIFSYVYNKIKSRLYYKNINGLHLFFNKPGVLIDPDIKYKMILPNGVDTSSYYPNYNVKNEKLKILFNAALSMGKGLDILLPVIERLKNNYKIEFHVAGWGELEKDIKQKRNIVYHGILSNKELAELYRECDLFVYPTRADTYSLVTLQALSSGLYVLCSDYLKGVFDDFEGIYLEYLPRNVDAYYNRIIEIAKNRDSVQYNKEEEYNYVKNNYDWKIISKKFYDYIRNFYNESSQINGDVKN